MAVSDNLLKAVKNYLNITWDDAADDEKLAGLIAAGESYLDGKLGTSGDYGTPGTEQMLLFDFVRYARDSALDVFENNYLSLLLGAQNIKAVDKYAESAEQANRRGNSVV